MFSEETNDNTESKEAKKPAKKAAPKKAAESKTDEPKAKAASKPKAAKSEEAAAKPAAKAKKAEEKTAAAPKAKKEESSDSVVRIRLENIKPAEGSRRALNRVGRGRASGSGKTCNRGHNGEGQRSGRSIKRGFEGGQMPMYRRMPKINGFKIIRNKTWLELTTKQLEVLSKRHGADLSAQKLEEIGLYNPRRMYGIRVYGNLSVTASFKVQAHHVTEGAKSAIEKAGGSISSLSA